MLIVGLRTATTNAFLLPAAAGRARVVSSTHSIHNAGFRQTLTTSTVTTRTTSSTSIALASASLSSPSSSSSPSSLAASSKSSQRSLSLSSSMSSSPSSSPPAATTAVALAHRLDGLDGPTVWHEFSPLAHKHQAVNLGQGAPDGDPPAFCVEAMKRSVDPAFGRHANQYARANAHLPLARVLAADYSQRWHMNIDPYTQIATAVGCTNTLYCALQGLLNPGDEVILIEPAFDIYSAQVMMAGGVPVYVPLRTTEADVDASPGEDRWANDVYHLDLEELRGAITERTKVLILNTPHNPTGKVFSRTELEGLAKIVLDHPQLIVISDEVYEYLIFEPETAPHISLASLSPEMFQQTLTLSSSGKTFSCTGWKVGWAVGPPHLVKAVVAVQQWVNYSIATPNQDAIAQALELAKQEYQGFDNYYACLVDDYKRKRGLLIKALKAAGMTPIVPSGTFFIMAETSHVDFPASYLAEVTEASPVPMPRDWALSRWMTKEVGVTAIPPSAFYSEPNRYELAKNFLRFAFCHRDERLVEAHRRLDAYFGSTKNGDVDHPTK